MTYKSEQIYGPFRHASILYSGKTTLNIALKSDTVSSTISLPSSPDLAAYAIKTDTTFSTLDIRVKSKEQGTFFGVNFEKGPGVYVDNYSFRGNSGLPLRKIPVSLFSDFNKLLHNKLIIIHFGLNVFTPGVSDYHWYEQALHEVIGHVKAASPGIPILMISMPDRAALIDGEYATPVELPDFIRLQERVASQENVAFFNLFNAMGGVNSMKNWVEGKTKLAGEDYTHPNGAGAIRIADMVYQYLMTGFTNFSAPKDSASTTILSRITP